MDTLIFPIWCVLLLGVTNLCDENLRFYQAKSFMFYDVQTHDVSIKMFCETDIIPHNIFHIRTECGEYFMKYCQSQRIMLWV